jgi:hypothetical protein
MLSGENVFRETVFAAKPFAGLFVKNLLLYNLLYVVLLSLLSGLMGMFVIAFSFLVYRVRILIFVPLFVIFQAGTYLSGLIYNENALAYFNTNILDYVGTDAFYGQSGFFIGSFLLTIAVFIIIAYNRAMQREDIL